MHVRRIIAYLCLSVYVLTGCSHDLKVKNIDLYRPLPINSQQGGHKIGIVATPKEVHDERLVMVVTNALKRDGFTVTYPFYQNEENKKSVDYIVKMDLVSEFRGSGWNFLVNWPGFLIWTPAWHGYNYGAKFNVTADITKTSSETSLPRLEIPIDLMIRHAAINRTWTEISWLEWSAIAFIGGLCFTKYDRTVTPILMDAQEDTLGDYIESKIAGAIIADSSATPAPAPIAEPAPAAAEPAVAEAAPAESVATPAPAEAAPVAATPAEPAVTQG